jgi:RNA polymerase sigma factor (sigma-70 family)
MYRTAVTGKVALAAEEARMARAAATGDGGAFAALYERYEQRAFNLAYRITGSEADAADAVQEAFLDVMRRPPRSEDHELGAFGPCLFAATRNAGYDLMRKHARTRPSETNLELQQVDIREASMRLPERQREVLALSDLEELSYGEIAAIMEVNGNTVAQLISRARINLCDEMRGTALASVAAPSAECERALPLIATRDDGQLEAGSRDAAWLDAHLVGCRRCRAGVEAMQEADAAYRAWAPIAAVPWLLKETMAKAAELAGADWSEATADGAATRSPAESVPGIPSAYVTSPGRGKRRGHRVRVAAGLGGLLLLAGVAAAVVAGDDSPATPADSATGTAQRPGAGAPEPGRALAKAGGTKGSAAAKKKAKTQTIAATETAGGETSFAPAPVLSTGGGGASEPASHPTTPGEAAVHPTQQTTAPEHSHKPKPAPAATPAPQPTSVPAPVTTEEAPPAEEPPEESAHGHKPPGKGKPPK